MKRHGKRKRVLALLLAVMLVVSSWPVFGAEPAATVVYHEDFTDGIGVATQSGGATLMQASDKVFDGNADGKALYVSNRANTWDAADFSFSNLGLEVGKAYTLTVKGYVDADAVVPAGAKAVLGTNQTYQWLANVDMAAGTAFTLTASYTATADDTALRIQSSDEGKAVPFFIGDVLVTTVATSTIDEIYHEDFVDGMGIATQSGGASLTHATDKVFDGNADGKALYVGNRVNTWDAADFSFSNLGLEAGETYTMTVTGYVDATETVTGGAVVVLGTNQTYTWVANTTITTGSAFALTAEYTYPADTTDTAFRVQTNEAGKAVSFYIGDFLVTTQTDAAAGGGEGEVDAPTREPATPFETISFEDGTTNGFVGRAGTEVLTVTEDVNHTDGGSRALAVTGRTTSWHGPTLRVEENIDLGGEYTISLWARLISPDSAQLQLSTQVGNGSGASYLNIQNKTISVADGWVEFTGKYRYTSVGEEFVTIYVESANAEASFYIDDISFVPTGTGPVTIETDIQAIKDVYAADFLIGSAVAEKDLTGVRFDLLNKHFNSVTAENAMKPGELQAVKGTFTFDAADAMVNAALAANMAVHGHVLVWHQQTPDWMASQVEGDTTAPLTRTEALDNMRTHIETVVEHFGDKVISWDVVNEAMNDNPPSPEDWKGSLRNSAWRQAIGDDYVAQAFLMAREVLDAHPEWDDIKLYYNDYNLDNQNKAKAVALMVKEINDAYAETHPGKKLIDGVGMQAHYNISTNPANVALSIERFISLGVEVSITELDVQAGSNGELPQNLADAQGYLYAQLFKIFAAHADSIPRVTIWGLDDGNSWRAQSNPLVFDANLQSKPAYQGVINPDAFIAAHQPDTTDALRAGAMYGTPTVDGAVDAVWETVATMPVNQYQMAWQGATGTARTLWDEESLYVLVQVSDTELDNTSANAWEQDSVEVFLDENNAKTSFYQEDDGQFRVNFENEASFNPSAIADGVVSAVTVNGTSYTVEMKLPFKTIVPDADTALGFDVQINDGKDGARQSVAAWNDTTGNGYQDTSVYGILTLIKEEAPEPTPTPTPTTTPTPAPSSNSSSTSSTPTPVPTPVVADNGIIRAVATVDAATGTASVTMDMATLTGAMEKTAAQPNGVKTASLSVPKADGAEAYEVVLPISVLSTPEQKMEIRVQTEFGEVLLPSGMLQQEMDSAGDEVALTITKPDLTTLDEATRTAIGNRPVIRLSLHVAGNPVSWKNEDAPVTVNIPYTPTAAELADPEHITIWYLDGQGNAVQVPSGRYDPKTGTVQFKTTHFSNYAVVFVTKTFDDMESAAWAQKAVEVLASKGALEGETAALFNPDTTITRAAFTSWLVKTLGLSASAGENFADVPAGAAYAQDAAVARKLGVANGTGNNQFMPDAVISRQDMMVLVDRALKQTGVELTSGSANALQRFKDGEIVAEYALNSVAALVEDGLAVGNAGMINPLGTTTRAEAAVLLYRIYNK